MELGLILGAVALLVLVRFFVSVTPAASLTRWGGILVRAVVIFALAAILWVLVLHQPAMVLLWASLGVEVVSFFVFRGAF